MEFKSGDPDASGDSTTATGDSATVSDTFTGDGATDTYVGTESGEETDTNRDSESDTAIQRDTQSDTAQEVDTVTDTGTSSGTGKETDTISETDGSTDSDTETVTETTEPTDTGSETVADTETATGTETATVTDTGTATMTDSTPGTDTETTSDSIDTGSATESDTGSETETETETETGSESDTVSETDTSPIKGQDSALFVNNHPNINGILGELLWDLVTPANIAASGDPDNDAFFDVVWDETNLYVAVSVKDSVICVGTEASPWWYDSVEIYIDPNNSKTNCDTSVAPYHCYDSLDTQMVIKYSDDLTWRQFGDNTQNTSLQYSATGERTVDGYAIEALIPWAGLGITPSAGLKIGFDIGINDNDMATCSGVNDTSRSSELRWQGDGFNFRTTAHFGELILSAEAAN